MYISKCLTHKKEAKSIQDHTPYPFAHKRSENRYNPNPISVKLPSPCLFLSNSQKPKGIE